MTTENKMSTVHSEEKPPSLLEKNHGNDGQIDRIATVEIDNYHGIDMKTVLVYLVSLIRLYLLIFD